MLEYVSDAVVLDKEPNGDLDVRVSLFTKKFGRLKAKAKSARKITSKLSAHLEPGNLIQVRLVEKNGLQVVDALKISALPSPLRDFYFLNMLLAEGEPDRELWQILCRERFDWARVLRMLGWDPRGAACEGCGKEHPDFFGLERQMFFCRACRGKRLSAKTIGSSQEPRDLAIEVMPSATL